MEINYDGTVTSLTKQFNGETEDGRTFIITANWNDWDEWNVSQDEISFDNEDGTDEEVEQIIEMFLKEMNG
jgi:hypothetical protein